MSECDGTSIPAACVDRFERGIKIMAQSAAQIVTIGSKVDTMHTLLAGNGEPDRGLMYRLAAIEQAAEAVVNTRRRWRDRAWEVTAGVAIGVMGTLIVGGILAMMSGCVPASKRLAASLTEGQAAIAKVRESVQAARTGVERVIDDPTTADGTKVALKPVVIHLEAADDACGNVHKVLATAQTASAGLKDVESAWMPMVKTAAIVLGMGIVLILLWKCGVFLIVKPIMARLGSTISPGPDPPDPPDGEPLVKPPI